MIVTVDTNVLVSGVFFGGIPGAIVEAARQGVFTMVLSPPLLSELGAVFSRPRFGLNPEAVQLLMTDLESSATIVYPESRRRLVVRDPDDDDAVVDCAIESRSKYIVSGDAHLSELGVVEGIPVVAPRQFVDLLREK